MKQLIALPVLGVLLLVITHSCTYAQTNLALNRPATASSVEGGSSYTANLAVDGNTSTRWSSLSKDPQWIYVDLGASYTIADVKITWESALGKNYTIDVSNDASTWTTIKTVTNNTSTSNDNTVSGSGRYVRIYGTARGTSYGYSIYELQVFGTTGVQASGNLALKKTATASSVQGGTSYTASLAVDGDATTRWSTNPVDPQWLYVDLGAQYTIGDVKVTWESAYAKSYHIDVSNDASNWTTLKTITNNTTLSNDNVVSGSGRYVRIYGTQRATSYGYSIFELEVYSSGTGGSTGGGTTTGGGSSGSSGGSTGGTTTGGTGGTSSGSGTMTTSGKTYYVSTADGDDSRSSTQAQSSSTPWKTISKVNSFFSSLQVGDQVAFKRGDTFYGSLTINKSGSSSAPILVGAYGSGTNPIITGFTTVTSWTSTGSGRYSATVPSGLSSLNMVTRDGSFQAMGKMPKGNTGYYNTSSASSSSISSSSLSGLSNFVGGEIVWRPYHWVLWRGTVTSQSSSSVSFTPFASTSGGGTENPASGYGFFFQNSPAACTQLGEWAYTSGSRSLTMYFGSDNPTSHTIRAATVDNLVTGTNINYVSINNIIFQGANSNIIYITNGNNITINSCIVSFAGLYGIFGNGSTANWAITNNTVSWSNTIAIRGASGASAWRITGNNVTNTGSVAGMGGSGEGQYFGIKMEGGNSSTYSNNSITNTGYIPFMFNGTNCVIQNNYIDNFGFVKDDVSGIYCNSTSLTGTKILGNIVLNGKGQPIGTPDQDYRAFGIYVDDGAASLEIANNTVAFMGRVGIYVHNGHDLNIHNNTLFDNHEAASEYYNDKNTIANVSYTNNINFAKTSSQLVYMSTGGSNSPLSYFSTLDNNHYCRPMNETNSFQTITPYGNYSLSSWKSYIQKDGSSSITPKTVSDTSQIKFFYNNTTSAQSYSISGTYIDVFNKSYTGSVSLQPYTSIVLVSSSSSSTKAVSNTAEVVEPSVLGPVKDVLSIYPNPVTDNATLQVTNSYTGKMNVQIVSETGAVLRSLSLNKEMQSNIVALSTNDLPVGVYFVTVQIGVWRDKRKFVKL